jgi:hypothetical protein
MLIDLSNVISTFQANKGSMNVFYLVNVIKPGAIKMVESGVIIWDYVLAWQRLSETANDLYGDVTIR